MQEIILANTRFFPPWRRDVWMCSSGKTLETLLKTLFHGIDLFLTFYLCILAFLFYFTLVLYPYSYFNSAVLMLGPFDIIGGLIKALVFGFLIGLISCYHGLRTKAGAKGVGESTTLAVVTNLIVIFVVNYFLSLMLF